MHCREYDLSSRNERTERSRSRLLPAGIHNINCPHDKASANGSSSPHHARGTGGGSQLQQRSSGRPARQQAEATAIHQRRERSRRAEISPSIPPVPAAAVAAPIAPPAVAASGPSAIASARSLRERGAASMIQRPLQT